MGGVFGLAKLADRLMDSWMKNPTLNANKAVAPWTQSGQAQGFKLLVTQVCDRPLENTRARGAEDGDTYGMRGDAAVGMRERGGRGATGVQGM